MKHVALLSILFASLLSYPMAEAQNCERYKDRADRYAKLRRAGGTSTQMARWQRERNRYNTRYQDCQRTASAHTIKTTRGPGANQNYADRRKERPIDTQDQVVRTLLETCNYWIRAHNSRPTRNSLSQRDYACHAADRGRREAQTGHPGPAEHKRTLAECIKPDNVIDDDVAACLQGRLEPHWLIGNEADSP